MGIIQAIFLFLRAFIIGRAATAKLICRMSRENSTWGAPRIVSELALLGHDVAERTVAKYMVRTRKPPSQTWRTFLDNHVPDIAACDFFTVPTVTFRVLYVFIVFRHDRRQVGGLHHRYSRAV